MGKIGLPAWNAVQGYGIHVNVVWRLIVYGDSERASVRERDRRPVYGGGADPVPVGPCDGVEAHRGEHVPRAERAAVVVAVKAVRLGIKAGAKRPAHPFLRQIRPARVVEEIGRVDIVLVADPVTRAGINGSPGRAFAFLPLTQGDTRNIP